MIKKNNKMCQICLRMVHFTFTPKRRCRKCYARYVLEGEIKSVFLLHDQLGTSRNVVASKKEAIKRLSKQKDKLVARILELVTRVGELEKNSKQEFVEPWPRPWYNCNLLTPQASRKNGKNK